MQDSKTLSVLFEALIYLGSMLLDQLGAQELLDLSSIVGSVVEFSPATRETGVRFPDNAKFSLSNSNDIRTFECSTGSVPRFAFRLLVKLVPAGLEPATFRV